MQMAVWLGTDTERWGDGAALHRQVQHSKAHSRPLGAWPSPALALGSAVQREMSIWSRHNGQLLIVLLEFITFKRIDHVDLAVGEKFPQRARARLQM